MVVRGGDCCSGREYESIDMVGVETQLTGRVKMWSPRREATCRGMNRPPIRYSLGVNDVDGWTQMSKSNGYVLCCYWTTRAYRNKVGILLIPPYSNHVETWQ